jgi:hypothetical protein
LIDRHPDAHEPALAQGAGDLDPASAQLGVICRRGDEKPKIFEQSLVLDVDKEK